MLGEWTESLLEEYNGFLVDGSVAIAHQTVTAGSHLEGSTRQKPEVRWCRSPVLKARASAASKLLFNLERDLSLFAPRYNIAPSQEVPDIVHNEGVRD